MANLTAPFDDPTDRTAPAEDLILSHLRLADSLAHRFTGRGESRDDLEAVAHLALVGATRRYDPGRGAAFGTFARVSILGELKRHLRDRAWAVRAPRSLHDLYLEMGGAREVLLQELGRPPDISDIAVHLGRGEEDILEAMAAGNAYHADSLDAPGRDGLPSPLEALGAEDDNLVVRLNRVGLTQAMEILSDRERHVLRRYFFDGRTQADIGRELCCSQMQVSRLIAMVLARLRCRLAD